MGLKNVGYSGSWPKYNLAGASVLDLGAGPTSMLLKSVGGGKLVAVDPCTYPAWTYARYTEHGIQAVIQKAEEYVAAEPFDECWIYNVLQHVEDPELVCTTARRSARLIRLFEWVQLKPSLGHPHMLTEKKLNSWLGGKGRVESVNHQPFIVHAKGYFGTFSGLS